MTVNDAYIKTYFGSFTVITQNYEFLDKQKAEVFHIFVANLKNFTENTVLVSYVYVTCQPKFSPSA